MREPLSSCSHAGPRIEIEAPIGQAAHQLANVKAHIEMAPFVRLTGKGRRARNDKLYQPETQRARIRTT
jgi:hypothetical protein